MCWQGAASALPMRAALRRNTLPGAGRWPEAFTLKSCPGRQSILLIYASSESLRIIKSLGFVSQLCCQLAKWPWANHVASGAQVALICRRRELDGILEVFLASQFHEFVENPGCGIGSGA